MLDYTSQEERSVDGLLRLWKKCAPEYGCIERFRGTAQDGNRVASKKLPLVVRYDDAGCCRPSARRMGGLSWMVTSQEL